MSSSSGWLIAKATTRAKESAGTPTLSAARAEKSVTGLATQFIEALNTRQTSARVTPGSIATSSTAAPAGARSTGAYPARVKRSTAPASP